MEGRERLVEFNEAPFAIRDEDRVGHAFERRLEFAPGRYPLGLTPLFLVDVLDDRHEILGLPVFRAHQRDRQADPDAPAPLAHVAFLERRLRRFRVEEPLQPTLVVRPIVRVGDVLETHPEQLILRVADDLGDPTIHPQPASVRSDQGDADGGLFEGRVEKVFTVALVAPLALVHSADQIADHQKDGERSHMIGRLDCPGQRRWHEKIPHQKAADRGPDDAAP